MADRDARWRQRLENYGKALARLTAACELDEYSDLERAGLAQTFAFTFELAWKTLKDRLFFEGLDANSPREAIRRGFEAGHLVESDAELFLEALAKRNLISHTYEHKTALLAERLIKDQYHPLLQRLFDALKASAA